MAAPLSYLCPFCDREVQVGKPCPGCAKNMKPAAKPARKTWEHDSTYDATDIPDEDFDYDGFIAREFGHSPHRQIGVKWYWWLLGVVVLAAMAAGVFHYCG